MEEDAEIIDLDAEENAEFLDQDSSGDDAARLTALAAQAKVAKARVEQIGASTEWRLGLFGGEGLGVSC